MKTYSRLVVGELRISKWGGGGGGGGGGEPLNC